MKQLSNKAWKSNRERKNPIRTANPSFQEVRRLFVLDYFVPAVANTDEEAGINDKKNVFFQGEKLKVITYWLMEETFMINQLMTW